MAAWNLRANEIFATAAELPCDQRQAYLVEVCGADSELRRQVDGLLAAHDQAGDFLDRPAAGLGTPDSGPPLPGGAGVVRALGVRLREVEGETETVAPLPADVDNESVNLPERYRMEGEIARGGMGAILKGRDEELGRDIAVKVLLETHQGRTELVQRFVEEAQIAGQLQHPGIVPVYEMGGKQGKRPYFTMKLVKGLTLANLLKERANPGDDLSRFVGIFEQVCQTLAYAHARGVIHRDLKPANIMVGAFGEVQVMDWGLAKLLTSVPRPSVDAEDPGTIIQTERSSEGEAGRTSAGSVLGTPSYMAPEQARGEVERIDERADVFGLGAILCEILTGKPPFAGKTSEAMRLARKGDLADALTRLDGCGADGELTGLAKRCLAEEPEGRPANAGEVAQSVIAYQHSVEERLRRAEVERERAQVRAVEEAKRRKVTLALAASVLLTVVLGGGGYAWLQQQQREQRAVRGRAIDSALDSVAVLRGRAAVALPGDLSAWGEAQSEMRRMDDLLAQGDVEEAVRERVQTVRDELQRGREEAERRAQDALAERNLLARLESIRSERSEHWDYRRADRDYADAFRAFGVDVDQDELDKVAAKLSGRPGTGEIVAALDEWCRIRREVLARQQGARSWRRLVEVARLADHDPWRNRLRETLNRPIKEAAEILKKQAKDVAVLEQQPAATLLLLARLLEQAGQWKEFAEVLRFAWRRFPGDFWVNHQMTRITEGAELVRFATGEVVARPTSASAHHSLGFALSKQGKLDEAIQCYHRAIHLAPKDPKPHCDLGVVLVSQGKVAEAIVCYRKAIALDPKCDTAHNNLGAALAGQGKLDEAIDCYRKAIEIDPTHSDHHSNLGHALADKGKLDEAIVCYRKAIALDGREVGTHNNLGNALRKQGKVDEAIDCFKKAIDIDPKYLFSHYNLGLALDDKGKLDEAIACYQKAIEIDPKYASAHDGLGVALRKQGKVDEAITCYRRAIELNHKFATAYNNLGEALRAKGLLDEAIVCFEKAIQIDPKHAHAHAALGRVLHYKERVDEAVACLEKAIEIDPKFAEAHTILGAVLFARGDFGKAEAIFRRCLELLPPNDKLRPGASKGLQACQLFLALEKTLLAVLAGRVQPTDAEWGDLLTVCKVTKRHHAAARLSAQAIASDPKRANDPAAGLRYNAACFATLAAAGQGKDADKLDVMQRLALRRQSLTWLRADLAQWRRLVESGEVGRSRLARTLAHWQKDTDLVSLRDAEALKKLSAEERQACERLWADVAALLKKGEPGAK